MRNLLLIATTTGYQTRALAEAAGRAGARVTLVTDRCDQLSDPWGDQAVPARFDAQHLETALHAMEALGPFDGVIASGDAAAVLAAQAADRFGLAFHCPEGAERAHDKLAFRVALAAAGLPHPRFGPAGTGAVAYPCVVKALKMSGSRGVIRADDDARFTQAIARLRRIVRDAEWLTEEYIDGAEYALEGWLEANGNLRTLALFDKPDSLTGPYFEETIYVTPSRLPEEERRRIAAAVGAAARAAGLGPGPIHAEARVRAGVPYVIEIAARPIGGLCARIVRFEEGGLEDYLVRAALGDDVSGWKREAGGVGVMMIPIPGAGILEAVEGVEEAARVAGIEGVEITARLGQDILPPPEGATYLGFIFARAATAAAAEASLRAAQARLRILIRPRLPLLP